MKPGSARTTRSGRRSAQGEFNYAGGTRVEVKFSKPVQAKFFKLVSTSELNGRPFTSIAELDMISCRCREELVLGNPFATVANTVNRTALTNYTDQSSKYMRNWHRLKTVFTAPSSGRVDVVLRAGPGADGAKVRFDDVRLVKTGVSRPPKGREKRGVVRGLRKRGRRLGPVHVWLGGADEYALV